MRKSPQGRLLRHGVVSDDGSGCYEPDDEFLIGILDRVEVHMFVVRCFTSSLEAAEVELVASSTDVHPTLVHSGRLTRLTRPLPCAWGIRGIERRYLAVCGLRDRPSCAPRAPKCQFRPLRRAVPERRARPAPRRPIRRPNLPTRHL